jgi:hypothetical protein
MLFRIAIIITFSMFLQDQRVADRVVAIVNDEPILLSDINYQPFAADSGDNDIRSTELMRMEGLINQTLIIQEVKRLKIFTVTREELDRYRLSLVPEEEENRLVSLGISQVQINTWIRRLILINKFIDYRFRRGMDIEAVDIREYYDNQFIPNFQRENPGIQVPSFSSQRSAIRLLLLETRVNNALEQWLTEARTGARIVIRY